MNFNRRSLMLGIAALSAPMPSFTFAQKSLLPLNTPGLDHLDVMVPDVEATTKFYMGLLKTELHAQAFRGAFRYFVLLNPLTESREVGYLAVGANGGRDAYIGHFCTSIHDWRANSEAIMKAQGEAWAAAGFGEFPGSGGFGALFTDPDGIEIQYLPAPDTLVTAAEPSQLTPWHQGLVTPHGVHNVNLRVRDLERALEWYGVLYGTPAWLPDRSMAYFEFPESQTRLYLEQARYEFNHETGIVLFGIKVDPFDRAAVGEAAVALGGTVLPSPGYAADALRVRDPDGNVVEFHPV